MAHVKQYPDLVRFEAMVDKAGRRGIAAELTSIGIRPPGGV